MMKRQTPKSVTLPNGRTFVARYERVTRNHLPGDTRLERPCRRRAAPRGRRCIQRGRGFGSNILKLF